MKAFAPLQVITLATLLSGLSMLNAVQAQPYGYPGWSPPPPYRAPVYPRGYRTPHQQTPQARSQGSVAITSPEDGAIVSRAKSLVLAYKVDPGPKGDHVHVYVDGREVAVLKLLEGSYTVGRLRPGRHDVAIKVVNRQHAPIGVESSISVVVR